MNNIDFFKSLNYTNGIELVKAVFKRFPLQYATTLGLDGKPKIRPIEFKFEENGYLYFDTVEFYTSYKEMKKYPYIQVCVCDQESMSYVRVEGKVNFTRDKRIIDKCFENSKVLTKAFGNQKEVVIGYYLTEVNIEFSSLSKELENYKYTL